MHRVHRFAADFVAQRLVEHGCNQARIARTNRLSQKWLLKGILNFSGTGRDTCGERMRVREC